MALPPPANIDSDDIIESIESDFDMPSTNLSNSEATSTASSDNAQLESQTCIACGNDSSYGNLVLPCDCPRGVYHLDCLQEMIPENQWQFNGVAQCHGCDGDLKEDALEQILEPVAFQEYKLRQTEVRTPFLMRTYCHDATCDTWISAVFGRFNGPTAYCSRCGKGTCTKCKAAVHPDRPECKDLWEQASDKCSLQLQSGEVEQLCHVCARPAENGDWTYVLIYSRPSSLY